MESWRKAEGAGGADRGGILALRDGAGGSGNRGRFRCRALSTRTSGASSCILATALLIAPHAFAGESKLEQFEAFTREHRKTNTVLSMSYAIVKDGNIVAAEGIDPLVNEGSNNNDGRRTRTYA